MSSNYQEIYIFIKILKSQTGKLTKQQLHTLKGQALAGDLVGAKKGLSKLISS